ncbi:Proton pump-interactor 1 [Acorus gramineus]|uniref:Proton pump-interactor 1 n=1 Tax=Acorus gramineus TaxID=55184 RepID=A0AAV9AQW9_ACOGR|nr:Proton pump-interactor 1 [Acorus gramineus]
MTADCNGVSEVEFEGAIGSGLAPVEDPAAAAKKPRGNADAETESEADGSYVFVSEESDGSVGEASYEGERVAAAAGASDPVDADPGAVTEGGANAGDSGDRSTDKIEGDVVELTCGEVTAVEFGGPDTIHDLAELEPVVEAEGCPEPPETEGAVEDAAADEIPAEDSADVDEVNVTGHESKSEAELAMVTDEIMTVESPIDDGDQSPILCYEGEGPLKGEEESTIVCEETTVVEVVAAVESPIDDKEAPNDVDMVPIGGPVEELMVPNTETACISIGTLEFETVIVNGTPQVGEVQLLATADGDVDLEGSEVCNRNEGFHGGPAEDDDLSGSSVANASIEDAKAAVVMETEAECEFGENEGVDETVVVVNETPESSEVEVSSGPIDVTESEGVEVGGKNESFGNSSVEDDELLLASVEEATLEGTEAVDETVVVVTGTPESLEVEVSSATIDVAESEGIEVVDKNVSFGNSSVEDDELVLPSGEEATLEGTEAVDETVVVVNGTPKSSEVEVSSPPIDVAESEGVKVGDKNVSFGNSSVEDDELLSASVEEATLEGTEAVDETVVVVNGTPESSEVEVSSAPINVAQSEGVEVGDKNVSFGNSSVEDDELLSASVEDATLEDTEAVPVSAQVATVTEKEDGSTSPVSSVEVAPEIRDEPIKICSEMAPVSIADDAESCSVNHRELASEAMVVPVEDVSPPGDEEKIGSEIGQEEEIQKGQNIDVDMECDQSANKDCDDKPIVEETGNVEVAGKSLTEENNDESDGAKRGPFYVVRVPRFADETLRERVNFFQMRVDELTRSRDTIRVRMQDQKKVTLRCWDEFAARRSEETAARETLDKKRADLDAVRAILNKIENAMAIDEISDKIRSLEHKMQHETVSLPEEKQMMREIKQLKSLREQRRSNMGSQAEVQEALDQRDEINERFRVLRQEFETLRSALSRCEGISNAARRRHNDEQKNLQILQMQHRAADDLRQEEYQNLLKIKREIFDKNSAFHKYKDDQTLAMHYASKGDREKLWNHCRDQMERIMDLWNNSDKFRNEYVKCNVPSTLRRLGTLDGRALGPDEGPLVHFNPIRNYKVITTVPTPTSEIVPAATSATSEIVHNNAAGTSFPVKTNSELAAKDAQKNQPAKKPKAPKKAVAEEIVPAAVSREVDVEEGKENEKKLTKEEEELARKEADQARKEEELRKEKAAAELKEKLRLEQKAKAKEAEERKRRMAEKAQSRAELRAKIEAENREKQREKREKKKERKRAVAGGLVSGVTEGEITPESDNNPSETTPPAPETKDKAPTTAVAKRSSRPQVVVKQKVRPLPPPLRNRGRRKMQTWMWAALVALALVALFLASNYGFSFKIDLPSFRI